VSTRTVPARPWPEIVAFYRSIPWGGALADLAEAIASSEQGRGLHACTSMHEMVIGQTERIEPNVNVLRIGPAFDSHDPVAYHLAFEFIEHPGVRKRWKRECAVEDGFATFQRFVRLQRWFVEYY
jgi:hypothetical protein